MAASVYDWSLTAASNSNADADIAWPEGQAPSTVNNSARAMMQRVAELLDDLGGSIAASGTANGLLVTAKSPFSAYADGQIVAFRATATNTGATTLSVNGIGAKSIRKFDAGGEVAIAAGDIRNTGIYVVRYSAALNAAAGAWLMDDPTYSGKAPTRQVVTATGTVTFTVGTRFVVVEGVGGGGGSGAVDGVGDNNSGSTGGGASGFSGRTGFIDVTGIATGSATIGAGGTAGAVGGAQGGNGGASSIVIGATTYTFPGGYGSANYTANASTAGFSNSGGQADTGSNTVGYSTPGTIGFHHSDVTASSGASGYGGGSVFGNGGPNRFSASATALAGQSPFGGFGGGAGGALNCDSGSDAAGAAGTPGCIWVWEYY